LIAVRGPVERYGDVPAVDGPTLDGLALGAGAAKVTGSLGPDGAGRCTTTRTVAGPDRPASGAATAGGSSPAALPAGR
jgi:ABC-type multidrug transport system ATPase subunit